MNGDEFIATARRMAENREVPVDVSNDLLWALAVDAFHERKALRKQQHQMQLRAAGFGGLAGLLTAGATLVAVLS